MTVGSALLAVPRAIDRALAVLLRGLVVVYRHTLSPLLGPRCKFHPSCSAYGLEALQVHGALKGTVLTTYRIGRCNPWSQGGVDAVPPKGRWKPDPYVPLESYDDLTSASGSPEAGRPDDRSAA